MQRWIRWILAGACGLLVYALIWPRSATSDAEREARKQGRTVIVYWDRHSGHEHEARRALIHEFNTSQDKVYVRALPIGYNSLMEKLLTSIAGSAPPDVCAIDGGIMAQLVAQGCFATLESFMAGCPSLREERFFPHIWKTVAFDGHVWGIPTTTDTYCLLWNKRAFRKAGLDPDRPPRTLAELEEYAARLTIKDESGIRQIGFLPWQPWDLSHMWGLLFGGTWYDESTGLAVCAGDPNLIRMFAWQRSFAIDPTSDTHPPFALDPEKVMSFQQGFGAYMSANNPFYSGKIAMITEGEWQVTFIPKYAPDLDWGVAAIPTPDGASPRAYGPTCIADCIPAGCRHPEAAWAYLEWFNSPRPDGRPSPASDYNYAIHNIPVRTDEARQARFIGDPRFRPFVDVLFERETVSAPVTPVTQFFMDEIERQRERVIYRKTSPEQALREIQNTVNDHLQLGRALAARTTP
ncbi:MAG TPA: ABC transporter substrate-binding protein [Candidatus Hydrogenedentes bacterium]|nr:ABC transporter substrate-binding protein [Candidatus Hydrogenedentota bacterium]HPG66633.1 ABC transporter substrate-binding protein [Candidatus Hydrogenedentota bacterium]